MATQINGTIRMSINDILDTYDTVDCAPNASLQHWYFTNQMGVYKQRLCRNQKFLHTLFDQIGANERHSWYLVANYNNTKVVPFLSVQDYNVIGSKNFQFLGKCITFNKYVVWTEHTVTYLGWALYLKIHHNCSLDNLIPLKGHQDLGQFNLLSLQTNFIKDIACVIKKGDKIIFTNTDNNDDATIKIFDVKYSNNEDVAEVYFGSDLVSTRNNVWFQYLLYDENVLSIDFKQPFTALGTQIDFYAMRWDGEPVDNNNTTIKEMVASAANHKKMLVCDQLTPSSKFHVEFEKHINESFEAINNIMIESYPNNNCGSDFLQAYMDQSEYVNFYVLFISLWQSCDKLIINGHDYTEEDILLYLLLLCNKFTDPELYNYYCVYVSNKKYALKFFDSLIFFNNSHNDHVQWYDSVAKYFAIHYSVFMLTSRWDINSNLVLQSDIDITIKCEGFFKKLKHNRNCYIFTGGVYEFVRSSEKQQIVQTFKDVKKDCMVADFVFNKINVFYMTDKGMFDMVKKIYRPACPFVLQSSLQKNFVEAEEVYIDQKIFDYLYDSIGTDYELFKVYHGKKVVQDFENHMADWRDSVHRNIINVALKNEFDRLVLALLNYKASDLIMIIMNLKLNIIINNIIDRPKMDIDVHNMQLAVLMQLLIPKSTVTHFIWCLMLNFDDDYYTMMEDNALVDNEALFDNKQKIVDALKRHFQNNCITDIILKEDFEPNLIKIINSAVKHTESKNTKSRILCNIQGLYRKYMDIPNNTNVWRDRLLEYKEDQDDNMYDWMSRFYIRMFINNVPYEQTTSIRNILSGLCCFRIVPSFHNVNSKVLMNFCASLAIPYDFEKMCMVLTSVPNCGKSTLFEILSRFLVVVKHDKEIYKQADDHNEEKIKKIESQLFVMNEASKFTKQLIKTHVDSTKIDTAHRHYCPAENFNCNYKVMVCNNERDWVIITDGYDTACSNRLGQLYFDHSFASNLKFSGSVYEHHMNKTYPEVKDSATVLAPGVRQLLSHVLKYKSDADTGYVLYKTLLEKDPTYQYNKQCLYIYNNYLQAFLYVVKYQGDNSNDAAPISSEAITDVISKAVIYVQDIVNYIIRKNAHLETSIKGAFHEKFKNNYNSSTQCYHKIVITTDPTKFRLSGPKMRPTVEIEQ